MKQLSFEEKAAKHTDMSDPNGCWQWGGAIDRDGYGKVNFRNQRTLAHRVAYGTWIGEIPAKYEVDHLCRNRACVNPQHLEAVTKRVNTLRSLAPPAENARRQMCIRGHEFTGIDKHGYRRCVTCERARARESYVRNRAARLVAPDPATVA